MKEHSYSTSLAWSGNTGNGTASYSGYDRSYSVCVSGKPALSGSSDPAFRGDKSKWNPEELLLASLSSCHMLWYLHLCDEAGVIVTAYTDHAQATMQERANGSGTFTKALLSPRVQVRDARMTAKAKELHSEAHSMCFIAASVNFPVVHEPNITVESAFSLGDVVPWGRSFNEYCQMFGLNEHELKQRILGCGDGPASFNAILTERGGSVVSVDPVYQFSAEQIAQRIESVKPEIMEKVRANHESFVWQTIKSPEELERIRLDAMSCFLQDYPEGKKKQRYMQARLPNLPFSADSFDLALVSHFLFLYSGLISFESHLSAVKELMRVSQEARIFPIVDMSGKRSEHFDPLISEIYELGYKTNIIQVAYEFQAGANEMLVITRA